MKDPESNRKTLNALARLELGLPSVTPSEHMKAIARRIEFLHRTIEARRASPGALNFYRAELAALRWAHAKLTPILEAERAARASAKNTINAADPPRRKAS